MKRLFPVLLLLLLVAGCRSAAETQMTAATPSPEAIAISATAVPTSTQPPSAAATATASQIFVPLAGGQSGTVATPDQEAADPALTDPPPPTATVPPTATPEPPFPRYDGPPIPPEMVGVQIYLHRQDMRDIVRHLAALDAGWVKVQVSWKLYEPRPGEYDAERFGELDRLVEAAASNGVDLLIGVSKAPEWSRPTTEEDGPPSDYAQFEAFTRYLATRYTGRVAAYELWNEPNLRREWNGAPLDPALLVELTRRGAAGIRSVDPAAQIISAAPATTGINDGVAAVDDRVYLRGMLEAGVAEVVDGVGVDPYGWANPPEASYSDAESVAPSHNEHPSFFYRDTMEQYRALLEEFGAGDWPLWATEFGWGTFDGMLTDQGDPAAPPAGAEFMANVTEWEQAEYILGAYELATGWPWTGPLFLWNLNFAPGIGPAFSESGYSILRQDGIRARGTGRWRRGGRSQGWPRSCLLVALHCGLKPRS